MEVFIIAIVMWWGDPTAKPVNDSVEIQTLHGKPLFFETREACHEHIDQNLDALKAFGRANYPTSNAVKSIYCISRERV